MPRMKHKPKKGSTDAEPHHPQAVPDEAASHDEAPGPVPDEVERDEAPDGAVIDEAASDGNAAAAHSGRGSRKRRGRARGNEAASDAGHDPADPGEDLASDESDAAAAVDSRALEALLLATHHPLTAGRIADVLGLPTPRGVRTAIANLNRRYEETDRSFRIEQVAGGFQILTLPEFGDLLARLQGREEDTRLSKAAQETLAVIAYKQPVLRSDVEAIRGVSCGETIRSLMEKRLVKIAGRAELPGRPILYGTTRRFLETFGLNSLKDLPKSAE